MGARAEAARARLASRRAELANRLSRYRDSRIGPERVASTVFDCLVELERSPIDEMATVPRSRIVGFSTLPYRRYQPETLLTRAGELGFDVDVIKATWADADEMQQAGRDAA